MACSRINFTIYFLTAGCNDVWCARARLKVVADRKADLSELTMLIEVSQLKVFQFPFRVIDWTRRIKQAKANNIYYSTYYLAKTHKT